VKDRGRNQKAIWTRVGAAWPNERGKGFTIELDARRRLLSGHTRCFRLFAVPSAVPFRKVGFKRARFFVRNHMSPGPLTIKVLRLRKR
jgi:hypothetical protein